MFRQPIEYEIIELGELGELGEVDDETSSELDEKPQPSPNLVQDAMNNIASRVSFADGLANFRQTSKSMYQLIEKTACGTIAHQLIALKPSFFEKFCIHHLEDFRNAINKTMGYSMIIGGFSISSGIGYGVGVNYGGSYGFLSGVVALFPSMFISTGLFVAPLNYLENVGLFANKKLDQAKDIRKQLKEESNLKNRVK